MPNGSPTLEELISHYPPILRDQVFEWARGESYTLPDGSIRSDILDGSRSGSLYRAWTNSNDLELILALTLFCGLNEQVVATTYGFLMEAVRHLPNFSLPGAFENSKLNIEDIEKILDREFPEVRGRPIKPFPDRCTVPLLTHAYSTSFIVAADAGGILHLIDSFTFLLDTITVEGTEVGGRIATRDGAKVFTAKLSAAGLSSFTRKIFLDRIREDICYEQLLHAMIMTSMHLRADKQTNFGR